MSRNGSGVYSLPAGYSVINGDTSDASQHTPILEDLETDMNTARPVVAGGTGSGTVAGARDNLFISGKVLSKSAGYTAVAADRAKLINGTASLTLALTAAATLGDGWFVIVKASTGNITIDPDGSETIDGAATLVIYAGQSATITCNGSAFFSSNTVAGALTSINIDGGTIDGATIGGATIATSNITVGASKTLNVSAGTLTLAANQIAGASVAIATTTTRGSVEFATDAEGTTGTSTTLVPPVATVTSMIDERLENGVGVSQTWQDVSGSRSVSTSYQNTTGRPIMVSVRGYNSTKRTLEVSTDNSTWVVVAYSADTADAWAMSAIVPNNHYYRINGTLSSLTVWAELR